MRQASKKMSAGQTSAGSAQWRRRALTSVSSLVLALAVASPAWADPYVGDLPIPAYENSGATVWTGAHVEARIVNPEGASILNQGQASGVVEDNRGVIRNAPGAKWIGDVAVGANLDGAKIVN